MDQMIFVVALVGVLGIGAQWIAWRFQWPAIVLLLAAGLVAGPLTGLVDAKAVFGEWLAPMVSVAVAIILFEGGLTLNLAGLRDAAKPVRRLIILGAPLAFVGATAAGIWVAGLSWQSAAVFGGILVVTGPTVIIPLLRQARLAPRPAALLRWEAIVADPLGALLAVLAYEAVLLTQHGEDPLTLGLRVVLGIVLGIVGGWLLGKAVEWLFLRGHVPEFLKIPVILVVVLAGFEVTNLVLKEAGLVTVTVMGMTLGNSRLSGLTELRRFKEMMTVLLVSGVFVVLTATLDAAAIASLDWRAVLFVAVLLLVVRPAAVWLATLGSGLSVSERILVGWIAPRGVVAVAVSGLFAGELAQAGIEDGARLVPLAFLVVFVTVILHGFSIGPLARLLKLASSAPSGVLIVGGSPFSSALALKLKELSLPVLVADRNWNRLRRVRQAEIPTFYGEVLSEVAEHHIDFSQYGYLIAAGDNDAYNALVCTDFGPEIGRGNVFQLARVSGDTRERHALSFTLGGRILFEKGGSYHDLAERMREGWSFQITKLSADYGFDAYRAERSPDLKVLLVKRESGKLVFATEGVEIEVRPGDTLLAFGPKPDARAPEASARKEPPAIAEHPDKA